MHLLFDIGGTKTRVALSSDGVAFSDPVIFETPTVFEDGIEKIAVTAEKLAGGAVVAAGAGGLTGSLATDKKSVVRSGHLLGWEQKPFVDALSHRLGNIPLFIENDTAIVGLGEAHKGAGRGAEIVVYITISTGVGGVRVVDGKIDRNRFGFEPGHQIVDYSGARKQLEEIVSGTAIHEKYGKSPREITDVSIWNEVADSFSAGLLNSLFHWSPDVVVLGGSMMNQPGLPLERIQESIARYLHEYSFVPQIKKAELADVGGLHGALVYLGQNL